MPSYLAMITVLSGAGDIPPMPSHPIMLPGMPGWGRIPGFSPGTPPPRPRPQPPVYPSQPIYWPPYPDQGLPGGHRIPTKDYPVRNLTRIKDCREGNRTLTRALPVRSRIRVHPIYIPEVPVSPEHPWVPPERPRRPGISPPWAQVPDTPSRA